MNKEKIVYAVIVNYNSGEQDLLRALRSLYAGKTAITNIVVIDNASRDGSLEACKKDFPRVHYIYNTHNIGFAAAANSGIRYSLEHGAEHVLLLNPDAYVDAQTISEMLAAIDQNDIKGILSPVIKFPKTEEVWFETGSISWWRFRAVHSELEVSVKNLDAYPVDYVSGCVALIHKEVFQKIGLLDERFFLYYEDVDFCVRARKEGFFVGVVPSALAWHHERSEDHKARKTYWLVRSGLTFFAQSTPKTMRWWFVIHFALRRLKNKITQSRSGDKEQHCAVSQAYYDYTHDTNTTY